MSTLKVGFSRPCGGFKPFSWLIRAVDQTPYSHVYIKFYAAKYDRWMVYQASGNFVNFFGPEAFAEEATVIEEFDIEVCDEVRTKVVLFAIDHAGFPYDLKSVFGIAAVKAVGLFGKKIDNPFSTGDNSFFCSKLVAAILIDIVGESIKGSIDTLTPKDIYGYLSNLASIPAIYSLGVTAEGAA